MKNRPNGKNLDAGTALVIAVTLGMFVLAIFVKGIGKDLLLEAGVLLVSIKLIMMSFKNASESQAIREDLDRIVVLLQGQSRFAEAPEKLEGPSK